MIVLLCDHAGFEIKEYLKNRLVKENYDIVDVGACELDENDDFSTYVGIVRRTIDTFNTENKIIAVCGSGVGMCIGLNKIKGVRCVVGHSVSEVEMARLHNDVNTLALGGRVTGKRVAYKMVKTFLETKSLGGKYARRMSDIEIK